MSKPLVFFGSGPLAAATLRDVYERLNIKTVITKPAPAHGHRSTPPVLKFAQDKGLTVYTPTNKQELNELFENQEIDNYCGLVVDYGIIIPESVINHFEHGIINSHFSLLPKWRGADPITFPLLEGEAYTGVSLMLIVPAMDEGDVLAMSELDIEPTDNAQTLTDKLVELSSAMLIEIIPMYLAGEITPKPQTGTPSYSRKLIKADGRIDWALSAEEIANQIRAFYIWPKSYTNLIGIDLIITDATADMEADGNQGEIHRTDDNKLAVYCGEGALIINKLKVSGKPEMTAEAFLAGYSQKLF